MYKGKSEKLFEMDYASVKLMQKDRQGTVAMQPKMDTVYA